MKKVTILLVASSIIAFFAIAGGCTDSNHQESVTKGSRKEATSNSKQEPIKRGCSRCGHRRTADQ